MGRCALPCRGQPGMQGWEGRTMMVQEVGSGCCSGLSEGVVLAMGFLSWVVHDLEREGHVWVPGGLGDEQW